MADRSFEVGETIVREIDLGGPKLRLRMPARPEHLLDAIDAAAFKEDEKMPYWGELWPAGRAFAIQLLSGSIALAGRDVLELGSGLGLVGIAAGLAGARSVTFSDYFEEALAFSAENAVRNGLDRCETLYLDWRKPVLPRRFELAIGADLLYERRNLDPLLGAVEAALAPDGTAYIADPGRITASEFQGVAEKRGFAVQKRGLAGNGHVYVLRRRPSSAP